ncbi:MAG: cytochrome c maturation protein CcmE [Proteobacteria bacterium]|jgi:cytochrome c-type biogenesis protein CcmE|nr:cytochrome c maturation protein CcmE [Pseudomonadota bacterium]
MSPATKKRLSYFLISTIVLLVVGKFVYNSLQGNTVYFFSPTDLSNLSEKPNGLIRVGGLVKKNSIKEKQKNASYTFTITDLKNDTYVEYEGLLPNLFQEGKGAVIEGVLKDKKFLLAQKILAKHDENYMPPEVAEALKKSGNWNKNYDQ